MFSDRYGYVEPSKVLIREKITIDIQNAICSCIDRLISKIGYDSIRKIGCWVWTSYLKKRENDCADIFFITDYIENSEIEWFRKLDMVEAVIESLCENSEIFGGYWGTYSIIESFVEDLNREFKRNNFAYRVVDNIIIEIVNEEEIKTIEQALEDNADNIQTHISQALRLCSDRDNPDYRNSIKESISAVEAYCREKTDSETLGDALKKLKNAGLKIPMVLSIAFEKLYAYTNQSTTGIRHALMEDTYMPTYAEAIFMLVSCSSFINYLNLKAINL